MASGHLFRIGSVNRKVGILGALDHNKRTPKNSYSPNIDVSRIQLNYALHDNRTADEIARYARNKMFEAGIERLRKNAVVAVEIIFSLPISFHQRDTRPFFNDCYEWVKRTFAGELLSFDVHLDEAAPHAHALILPLIDGKMQGSKLKGNRDNMIRLNNLFVSEVASRYGLSGARSQRLSSAEAHAIKVQVLKRLKTDPAMLSEVWPCIRDAIDKNPLPFAEALSITINAGLNKSRKSFVEIMTSTGKGKDTSSIGNYA